MSGRHGLAAASRWEGNMGFFEGLTQSMNLDQSFQKGQEITQRTNSFRLMQAQFDMEKTLRTRAADLQQQEFMLAANKAAYDRKVATDEANRAQKLIQGIQSSQNQKAIKGAKSARELADVPTTGDLRQRGGGLVTPAIDPESMSVNKLIGLAGTMGQAGDAGKAMLTGVLKIIEGKLPPDAETQSIIDKNKRMGVDNSMTQPEADAKLLEKYLTLSTADPATLTPKQKKLLPILEKKFNPTSGTGYGPKPTLGDISKARQNVLDNLYPSRNFDSNPLTTEEESGISGRVEQELKQNMEMLQRLMGGSMSGGGGTGYGDNANKWDSLKVKVKVKGR